ncbi:MAG: hypothetical protein JNN20_03430 [Betaproteobacteria bacterium]|nr:hypothetical protein [Betaproteobacteria bacterium]
MDNIASDLRQDVIHCLDRCIPARVLDCTVAIVQTTGPLVRQLGTGVLFRVADHRFVVTAAHVLATANDANSTIGISNAHGGFIALPGTWLRTTANDGGTRNDPYDVAVRHLTDEETHRLHGKTFQTLTDISFGEHSLEDHPHACFLLCGFPNIWWTTSAHAADTMRLKVLQYTAFRYEGSTAGLAGFESRLHFLLDAKEEEVFDPNGNEATFRLRPGQRARWPQDVAGVSGCGVWRIGNPCLPVQAWRAEDARLVGVLTSVYAKPALIKTTKWIAVTTLLNEAFPALRPHFT